jgi:hypothetical protein
MKFARRLAKLGAIGFLLVVIAVAGWAPLPANAQRLASRQRKTKDGVGSQVQKRSGPAMQQHVGIFCKIQIPCSDFNIAGGVADIWYAITTNN